MGEIRFSSAAAVGHGQKLATRRANRPQLKGREIFSGNIQAATGVIATLRT
jgi:hypothetical protein